jgi:hypothetical protein
MTAETKHGNPINQLIAQDEKFQRAYDAVEIPERVMGFPEYSLQTARKLLDQFDDQLDDRTRQFLEKITSQSLTTTDITQGAPVDFTNFIKKPDSTNNNQEQKVMYANVNDLKTTVSSKRRLLNSCKLIKSLPDDQITVQSDIDTNNSEQYSYDGNTFLINTENGTPDYIRLPTGVYITTKGGFVKKGVYNTVPKNHIIKVSEIPEGELSKVAQAQLVVNKHTLAQFHEIFEDQSNTK